MLNKVRLFIALLLGLTLCASHALATTKPVIDIQHWQTTNGTQVYFVERHELPILDIRLIFRAGSAYDGQQFGIAALTNAMLAEGTDQMDADQIAAAFDKTGAQFSLNTNTDMGLIALRSLSNPEQLNPALTTLTAVLTHANFPDNAFHRLQQQTLSAIAAQAQSPSSIAMNKMKALLYGTHAYGHPTIGTTDTIKALTSKDLTQFYHTFYTAHNAILVLVGDSNREGAEKIANQLTAKLPIGKMMPTPPEATPPTKGLTAHIPFPSAQTHILFGLLGINHKDPNLFPLMVGDQILGAPLTGRLFDDVRKKQGLAYSATSQFAMQEGRGPFIVSLQTRNSEATQAQAIAQKTLQHFIEQGPSAKEMDAAKKYLIGAFPFRFSNNAAITSVVSTLGFYHLPLDYLDNYTKNISVVTKQAVQTAFQKTLALDKMVTVTVGNTVTPGKQSHEHKKQ